MTSYLTVSLDAPQSALAARRKREAEPYLRKIATRRVLKQSHWEYIGRTQRHGTGKLDDQVAHHLARGRDLGRIVTWMDLPASVVAAAIERVKARAA